MKPLPLTPEVLNVARRVVWFKAPEDTLKNPIHFLAHVMTFGTIEDIAALDNIVGPAEWKEVLEHAPPGVFDPRSWAYWHVRMGYTKIPRPPKRHF